MKSGHRIALITSLTLATAALLGAGTGQDLRRLRGSITIDGSSTVYPITEAIAESFKTAAPNVKVTVGVSGTGGGFKRFAANETDISNASRPIKAAEAGMCTDAGVDFIEIPVAYDGLTIVVNKGNYWAESMTVDDLRKVFLASGAARTWQDVRPEWPDRPINIYCPGTDSGTFDYFKEVVAGKKGSIRSDMSVSEDDNVLVRGVSGDEGGIGFFGVAYYLENKDSLRAMPIINKAGKAVGPTPKTIENGTYNPFSRPLFIYVKASAARKPFVRAFVDFYLRNAAKSASEVGYVGLPEVIYGRARETFETRRAGSFFLDEHGEKKTGPVTEIYR
ncbi:MAG: PstS family phosphate ABC transporter substrate-binding protein [Phycisphaerales bacterium]|nr:PstS family phosphate ABC transporter substrate-binding protein [Phycisphaerales bacterium]